MPLAVIAGACVAAINVIAWAAFRIDKARARRGARRIRERTLLILAALGGGGGALVAMYAHHQRHKVAKRGFAALVWLAFTAQVALAGWLVAR
jgi:uncharacterized membrane protein YsdA (DUF1294 family)